MATLALDQASPTAVTTDALVVAIAKGDDGAVTFLPAPGVSELLAAFDGTLVDTLRVLGAGGGEGELTRIPTMGRIAAAVLVTVGVGKKTVDTLGPETLRRVAGAAIRGLAGTESVALALPIGDGDKARAAAEGALLGAYAFTRFRSDLTDHKAPVPTISLLGGSELQPAADRAGVVAPAVHLARDLVNTPPSHLHPPQLADAAVAAAREAGIEVEVLEEAELEAGGYGGILGVGKGAEEPPRLVVLRYAPAGASRHLALVGKGITFDSGGLSLKPPAAMETMKCDMGGAAAVIAAVTAVAKLGLPVRVTAYAAIAENLPSGTAQRPSDVLTTRNGKTVEVLNTDAEGRLVLADALADASAENPDLIVDVATLTGAQMVALGNRTSAVMSGNDDLSRSIAHVAERAGEAMWPMPLPPELRKSFDSQVADMANMGDRFGGMLVAGLFLKEFVAEGQNWVHLDIAGPAFNSGPAYGFTPAQGTGASVLTLIQIATEMADGRLDLSA